MGMKPKALVIAFAFSFAACGAPAATPMTATATPHGACDAYAPPSLQVDATIQHLKTSASVVEVTSPCTVRVRIDGGAGTLAAFNDRVIALRVTARTTFASAPEGDPGAITRFGFKPGDAFTLSFDSRPFPDGSFPVNYMNR